MQYIFSYKIITIIKVFSQRENILLFLLSQTFQPIFIGAIKCFMCFVWRPPWKISHYLLYQQKFILSFWCVVNKKQKNKVKCFEWRFFFTILNGFSHLICIYRRIEFFFFGQFIVYAHHYTHNFLSRKHHDPGTHKAISFHPYIHNTFFICIMGSFLYNYAVNAHTTAMMFVT